MYDEYLGNHENNKRCKITNMCKGNEYRAGADLGILKGGGFWARILRRGGGGVRVQVRGYFHVLTSNNKKNLWIRYCREKEYLSEMESPTIRSTLVKMRIDMNGSLGFSEKFQIECPDRLMYLL